VKVRDFLEIDYILLLSAIILTIIGILFIYSSGVNSSGEIVSTEYRRQIVWAAGGLLAALVIAMVNYRRIYGLAVYLYLGTLALLVYTSVFGRVAHGSRWIRLGSFGLQASEFAKITTILLLARFLADTRRNAKSFGRIVMACIIVFIPMGVILVQPDLGTALVYIPILVGMTYVAGVSRRYVLFLGACIMVTALFTVLPLWQSHIMGNRFPSLAFLTNPHFVGVCVLALALILAVALFGFFRYKKRYFFWIAYGVAVLIFSLGASFAARRVLKEYQIMRLIVFLNPNVAPLGAGWHIIQSITAIGSGGLWGKGYLQGTQSHYRFLPEQSTDFIFSIFSEEWGFFGGIVVFFLFFLMFLRFIRIMKNTPDPFGLYIVAGLSSMYAFHFLINVGMTMGIMPITGIPLLFMSYGGSALLSAMIGIGLALSVYLRRYEH
jgi:rod shape determining protein RodA